MLESCSEKSVKKARASCIRGCFAMGVLLIVATTLLLGFYLFLDKGQNRVTMNIFYVNGCGSNGCDLASSPVPPFTETSTNSWTEVTQTMTPGPSETVTRKPEPEATTSPSEPEPEAEPTASPKPIENSTPEPEVKTTQDPNSTPDPNADESGENPDRDN